LIANIVEQFGDFLFENSCCSFLKPFLVTDIAEFSTESKRHMYVCTEDEVEIFIGTWALLGIFAYICRQRPVIHWWRWGSWAQAAWHHWCGQCRISPTLPPPKRLQGPP